MKLLKFHAYYQSHKRTIQTAIGAFTFFLSIGAWMLIVIPWNGKLHANIHHSISKSEMCLLLLKFFNIINLCIITLIAIITALSTVISIATSKLFGYFNIENPMQNTDNPFSAVQAIVALLVSSHAAYLVLVAVMYKY